MAGGVIDEAHITLSDMESYLQGLGQLGKTPRTAPYTVGQLSLSPSQTAATMRRLGYSQAQINAAMSGNLPGHGSAIGNALQGVAGTLAALGPEAAPLSELSGVAGDLFGAGSDAASAASDLPSSTSTDTPAGAADTTEAGPSLAQRALPALGTGGALTAIWDTIRKDLKYAAIWVGLVLLGFGLIFEGLSRNGVPVPSPTTVLFAGGAAAA